jgi:dTDP-4-amino-4,6-dideoxy-D-galactose acyltransferase
LSEPLIAELEWDSAFFGFPIARTVRGRLGPAEMDAALSACRERGVRCLYLLTAADDERTSMLAQERGFRLHDVRLELDCVIDDLPRMPVAATIRRALPEQRCALELLARERFGASRFFADPGFSDGRASDLFVAFLARGLATEDRFVLTDQDAHGLVVGLLQPDGRAGAIELIGVTAVAEGTGLAAALIDAAHREFVAAARTHSEVVTQARNVSAQRLYQRLGYRTRRAGLWFHRWFD